jgi:hypothetical protein
MATCTKLKSTQARIPTLDDRELKAQHRSRHASKPAVASKSGKNGGYDVTGGPDSYPEQRRFAA